jgi:hypothetical protein
VPLRTQACYTGARDWAIPDPRDMGPDEFRAVRDLIGRKVRALLEGL